jgi:Domain of unknown function (DUF1708)
VFASDRDSAADASSHLFFAYLRSLSPDPARGTKGIIGLPTSLQQLVQATEYPPEAPTLMFNEATKVVMIVDTVSPTPYALLRRAKNFEYRDDDSVLQQFANYEDPVRALTDECRRVLKCISSTNQSTVSTTKASTSLRDASWSRFQDIGFGATIEESDGEEDGDSSMLGPIRHSGGIRTHARSENGDMGRPTTPSWADFLSSGFTDENGKKAPSSILLPPDKVLPPIQTIPRGQSSQSHRRNIETESMLEPGELASIDKLDLDDSFWWVWISSLAGEEPTSRKAVFGRCALIETVLIGGKWMIMEEQVKGAAPEPAPGAYIAEKKGFFGFTTRRGRLTRRKSALRKSTPTHDPYGKANSLSPATRTNITPDQHARVQAAAAQMQRRNKEQERLANGARRGRQDEVSNKTNSVMTLQPVIMSEASQAMKWASQYDKKEIRSKYLGDDMAGKGSTSDFRSPPKIDGALANDSSISLVESASEHQPPPPPEKSPRKSSPSPLSQEHLLLKRNPSPPLAQGYPLPQSPSPHPAQEYPLPKSPSPQPIQESTHPIRPSPPPAQEYPLPKSPSPPTMQEYSSPKTPTPPPVAEPPLPEVPTVSASRAAEPPPAPLPPIQMGEPEAPSPPEPTITALPEPPSPPVTKPPVLTEAPSNIPRKAVASSPDQMKSSKKRTPGAGIRGIFGSKRTKEPVNKPVISPPIQASPAIAAARAALAAKSKSPTNGVPVHQSTTQIPRSTPSPVASRSKRPVTPPSQPTNKEPALTPISNDHTPQAAVERHPDGAPKTRRDSDYEKLSRVDTNEREQADREFSTFDQGPLLDQPAFIPPDSPLPPDSPTPMEDDAYRTPYEDPYHAPSQPAVPSFTNGVETKQEDDSNELTRQVSPMQDRWAQIRKNAADRAARQSEEQSRQSEVKTDDGDTSEGESKSTTTTTCPDDFLFGWGC